MRLLPWFAALSAFVFFGNLGHWQLQRAAEKEAILADLAKAATLEPQAVHAMAERNDYHTRARLPAPTGTLRHLLLDAQTHQGRNGQDVLSAWQTKDGWVLVNRGWVPADSVPELDWPAGQAVVGLWAPLPAAGIRLGEALVGEREGWPVVNYPTQAEYSELLGGPVADGVLLQDANTPGGFVRDWQPVGFGPDRHYGYATTWFALAATVLIVTVALWIRGKKHD